MEVADSLVVQVIVAVVFVVDEATEEIEIGAPFAVKLADTLLA